MISIHALREEGDTRQPIVMRFHGYFYPRPPRGGRPGRSDVPFAACDISIHALREEGDRVALTAPDGHIISIHALREEGDLTPIGRLTRPFNFYPRPPRGGRRRSGAARVLTDAFLSTPSARRATQEARTVLPNSLNFYPRPPRGGRQQKQRENPLLLSHYTPLCTNCKEVPVKQTAKSHRYLRKRLVFRCEASGKTMCATCSHWRGIKRSAHYPAQTPGAAQHARP